LDANRLNETRGGFSLFRGGNVFLLEIYVVRRNFHGYGFENEEAKVFSTSAGECAPMTIVRIVFPLNLG